MKIVIDNKTWKGAVTVYDRLFLPQVELIEDARRLSRKAFDDEIELHGKDGSIPWTTLDKFKIPALIACVENWEVEGFTNSMTLETFPLSPRKESHELINQVFKAIERVYDGELEIPNE